MLVTYDSIFKISTDQLDTWSCRLVLFAINRSVVIWSWIYVTISATFFHIRGRVDFILHTSGFSHIALCRISGSTLHDNVSIRAVRIKLTAEKFFGLLLFCSQIFLFLAECTLFFPSIKFFTNSRIWTLFGNHIKHDPDSSYNNQDYKDQDYGKNSTRKTSFTARDTFFGDLVELIFPSSFDNLTLCGLYLRAIWVNSDGI